MKQALAIKKALFPLSLIGIIAVLTSGCLQSKDHLKLNADGSGRWTYRVTLGPQMAAMVAADSEGGPQTLTAAGVKEAAKQAKGVVLKTCKETRNGASQTLTVDLTFESIAELAASPFAEQLGWELKSEGGQLVILSKAGPLGGGDDDMNVDISGMKPMLIGFQSARMVTLPNPVIETDGQKRETHAAVWSFKVDANTTDADMKKMTDARPRAACAMTGITMALPVTLTGAEAEEHFGGEHEPTPASQTAAGISLQPVHTVVHREQHYVPTNILSMGRPLTLTFDCSWPEGVEPAGYSDLTISAASDNAGTDLKLKDAHRFHGPNHVHDLDGRDDAKNTARFDVELGLPTRDATTFSVAGHFNLHVPKRIVPVHVANPKGLVGKALEAPELAEFAITLKRFSNGQVELSAKKDLSAIKEIRLENDDGSEQAKSFSSHSHSFGGKHSKSVHFSGASKLKNPVLVLVVAEDIERQRVEFEFTDLKLP